VPGVHLKQLDFGKDGQVWGMATDNVVYYREGITVKDTDGTNWRVIEDDEVSTAQKPGHVTICASGVHTVWSTSETDATKLLFRNGVVDRNRLGLAWETVDAPAEMEQISCGANMQLWGVSSDGRTWVIENPTRTNPKGTGFKAIQQEENNDCNVAAGQTGEVWKVTKTGTIFRRQGITAMNFAGSSWSQVEGSLKQVSVGHWDTWGITKYHEVVRRSSVSKQNPTGDEWNQVPGSMMYIAAAEEGMAWAIDLDHEVWIYHEGEITWDQTENEKHWNEIDQGYVFVDVGRDGRVIAITLDGKALYRTGITMSNPAGSGWIDISMEGKQVDRAAIGDDGFIYVQAKENGLTYFRTGVSDEYPTGNGW